MRRRVDDHRNGSDGWLRAVRKYLGLTFRQPRWVDYEAVLRGAREAGYDIVPLELWLADPARVRGSTLVLRHDVDLLPRNARTMSDIEKALGVTSTFYFRWTTFDPDVVAHVRRNGSQVGLHYETLTRYARERALRRPEQITLEVLDACREELKEEIRRFRHLAGVCESVAAHGDRRAHLIARVNSDILVKERYKDYGIRFSADDEAARDFLDCWVSDGEAVVTTWGNGISPAEAIAAGHQVILFNSHPNHWGWGSAVVASRLRAHAGYVLRHPMRRPEWGEPECLAWQRFRD